MIKWEYLVVELKGSLLSAVEVLNKHGFDGWEFVSSSTNTAVFKRPIQPVNALGDESQMGKVESVELKEGYWNG